MLFSLKEANFTSEGETIMGNALQLLPATQSDRALLKHLEEEAGTEVNLCYQCGKCSAQAAFELQIHDAHGNTV